MPRKGSSKVKTGCLTCKVRKVKCDEGKPHCRRCVSTGRKCDGYVPVASSTSLSWHRPRHLFPNVDDVKERRALQFFCQAAGPSLSGPMDPYFWTHLVMQFSTFEPAVRHSVVAISSLYERIHSESTSMQPIADNRLALFHYNSAIRDLKSMENEPLVLLVCILFVCIEFLLGNREAAIQHCKHGVLVLENAETLYPWTKEHLSPIFRRLTLFPFFFGFDYTSFPKLVNLDDQLPPSFESFEEALYYLDGNTVRTVRLVRRGDDYRLGDMRHKPVSSDLLSEQRKIKSLLGEWNSRFLDVLNKPSAVARSEETLCNINLKYEVSQIWADVAFEYDETIYDKYLDKFRSMVAQAAQLHLSKPHDLRVAPKFIFEMGFVALLFYIVIKCRCLETRLRALSLMKVLGVSRENLWEVAPMHAIGRRSVELEHDCLIDETDQLSTPPRWPGLPPDESRIRDSTTSPSLTIQTDAQGQEIIGRTTGFFKRKADGSIYIQNEFIPETWKVYNH
ncbi:uncharacterized protein F4822DRAFT_300714 [Hypoxylon trugodes]|uniref:uncharacterized protein n=1 Tax=Hypoxylon trugodes TaxID=326681 RepID=UPI002199B010|nr:uncharacterized protein F4822DRAFT_300714 [Hypoxylon trugodes]KAI1388041.1 hypothetical protein F4822DRAFT_300714 [Hypoxylon trugodes]